MPTTNPATGSDPSAQFGWEQKLYSVVNSPVAVILKTVPASPGPKAEVVP